MFERANGSHEDLDTRDRVGQPIQLSWRINMQDTPIEQMNAENVEEFAVLIFESRDLEVSVISFRDPFRITTEHYDLSLQ
jgi:hypothetical protein